MKFCRKCQIETERGKSGQCKLCVRSAASAWAKENPEKVKARYAAWYAVNSEKRKAYNSVWAKANPEKVKATVTAWVAANPERNKANHAAWSAANRDKLNAKSSARAKAHPEKRNAQFTAWCKANPEAIRVHGQNRRALKRSATGKHTAADIKALFALQKGLCVCCRISIKDGYHVDHIYALVNGGSNDKHNLQLLCQSCNNSKHAKDPIDFMQSRGFLL